MGTPPRQRSRSTFCRLKRGSQRRQSPGQRPRPVPPRRPHLRTLPRRSQDPPAPRPQFLRGRRPSPRRTRCHPQLRPVAIHLRSQSEYSRLCYFLKRRTLHRNRCAARGRKYPAASRPLYRPPTQPHRRRGRHQLRSYRPPARRSHLAASRRPDQSSVGRPCATL